MGIFRNEMIIPANSSIEVNLETRALTLIDVNAGVQTILCLNSYWINETLKSLGDDIVSVSRGISGQSLKITNKTSTDITVMYNCFSL